MNGPTREMTREELLEAYLSMKKTVDHYRDLFEKMSVLIQEAQKPK